MVQLPEPFNPAEVAPSSGGGGSFPASDKNGHLVKIVNTDMKPTANGEGAYLELTLEAMEGSIAGDTMPYRLNLVNANQTAVRIAYEQLSAVAHVVGWLQRLDDADVLMHKPFRCVVALDKDPEKALKGYTRISHVLNVEGKAASECTTATAAAPAPAPAPAPAAPVATPAAAPASFPVETVPVPETAPAATGGKAPWEK